MNGNVYNYIRTEFDENPSTNVINVHSTFDCVQHKIMSVDKMVFKEDEQNIKEYNEERLIIDIHKMVNNDLITKYTEYLNHAISDTQSFVNDIPMDRFVRLKIEDVLMSLLLDMGFSLRLINDVRKNMRIDIL